MKVSSIKNWLQNNIEVYFEYNYHFRQNLFFTKKKSDKILKTSRLIIKYNPKFFTFVSDVTFVTCHLITILYTLTRRAVVCICECVYMRRDLTTRQLSLAVYAVNE